MQEEVLLALHICDSAEVFRVSVGVFLPHFAFVVHRVLQAVPVFFLGGGRARKQVPRAPVLVQVLESGQVPMKGCVLTLGCTIEKVMTNWVLTGRTPSTVVFLRPLQQSYTPPHSSEVAHGVRSFTKKSNDSFVGQRQSFVVVQQACDTSTQRPRVIRSPAERVEVEPERVSRRCLGGVPPQLAHLSEVVAGPDALDVREDHGRDIQVRIEARLVLIDLTIAASKLHGRLRGRECAGRGFLGHFT